METNEELARHCESLKAQGTELDGLVRVKAEVKANADTIYSIRFTRDEMNQISAFAKAHDMKVSAVIRQAALAAVAGELDISVATKARALREVQEHPRALAEAASRL